VGGTEMNKYSIIISYRHRQNHLDINIPRLHKVFTDLNVDFEIIVVEQNDGNPFCRGQLFNEGAKVATGNILIFHDIDHYPTDGVNYINFNTDVFLPIAKVIYVDSNLNPKPTEAVPSGYRHFKDGVDANFFGGISIFKRDKFFEINGFSNVYVGWGLEDADLRERVLHYKLSAARDRDNTFLALDHPDSGVPPTDPHFQNNNQAFGMRFYLLKYGVNSQLATVEEATPPMKEITKWLKVTDFAVNEDLVT
jgi:predicted glycosyltransferase involved in capsule biosynthesis